jgi:hypothetical protein
MTDTMPEDMSNDMLACKRVLDTVQALASPSLTALIGDDNRLNELLDRAKLSAFTNMPWSPGEPKPTQFVSKLRFAGRGGEVRLRVIVMVRSRMVYVGGDPDPDFEHLFSDTVRHVAVGEDVAMRIDRIKHNAGTTELVGGGIGEHARLNLYPTADGVSRCEPTSKAGASSHADGG